MAQLRCLCENHLSNVCCPNTMEGDLRSSYGYKDRSVWECSECGRLAIDIEDDDGLSIVKWYKPENGEVGNLFNVGTGEEFITWLKRIWIFHKEEFKMFENGDL